MALISLTSCIVSAFKTSIAECNLAHAGTRMDEVNPTDTVAGWPDMTYHTGWVTMAKAVD